MLLECSSAVVIVISLRDRKKGYEVAVMKRAMEMLGKPAGPVRPPLCEITEAEEAELRRVLDLYAAHALAPAGAGLVPSSAG